MSLLSFPERIEEFVFCLVFVIYVFVLIYNLQKENEGNSKKPLHLIYKALLYSNALL